MCVCACVCVQVLYGLDEDGKEKSDDSRPLLGDKVSTISLEAANYKTEVSVVTRLYCVRLCYA